MGDVIRRAALVLGLLVAAGPVHAVRVVDDTGASVDLASPARRISAKLQPSTIVTCTSTVRPLASCVSTAAGLARAGNS